MSWKDPFITLTFPSKIIYAIGSILLLIIHTGVIIGDVYHFFVSQRGDLMSFHFTGVLLTSHVTSFYWALLSTIYTLQADDDVLTYIAAISLALNCVVILARFCMDFATIDYREERY